MTVTLINPGDGQNSGGSVDLTSPGPIGSATPAAVTATDLEAQWISGVTHGSTYSGRSAFSSGYDIDRLFGCTERCGPAVATGVGTNAATGPAVAVDKGLNSFMRVTAATGVVTYNLIDPRSGSATLTYPQGIVTALTVGITNIQVELVRPDDSTTEFYNGPVNAAGFTVIPIDSASFTDIDRIRFTLTKDAALTYGRAYMLEYSPNRPSDYELPVKLHSFFPRGQKIVGPSLGVCNSDESQLTVMGQGTLRATNIPEYADDAAADADATLEPGSFYRITGSRPLLVKP